MKMVRRVPRSGSGKRREWERCGAEGQQQRVPAMGTGKRQKSAESWEAERVPRMRTHGQKRRGVMR
jgi:hypothetical protein